MTKLEFQSLTSDRIVILDGACGTNLQKAGMPVGVCPEQWILEHPEIIKQLQQDYITAGTNILYVPTFTANRIKLAEYGLEDQLVEINTKLVELSKEAAGNTAYVAGDLTMTGQQLYPLGELLFEDLVTIYKEQAKALYEAGVDLFIIETMMSLQETRAAVIAIQETCSLPVMASLTFEADGKTLFGTDPKTAVVVLQSLGVDAVGLNCSTGPLAMLEIVEEMYAYANIPILSKPNAGLPELENGRTVYKSSPEEFAAAMEKVIQAGACIVGGCCGTTPAHIEALAKIAAKTKPLTTRKEKRRVLASERKTIEITLDGPFQVIGERINPTGKKKLQADLKEGSFSSVRSMAKEQEENGAVLLDVNVGMNGIDEKQTMLEAVYQITSTVDCPLCLDSSSVDVIEAALRIYPGRALINSISLESEKITRLLPIAKRYGAMFILLPLSDEGLPKTLEEKHRIVHTVLDRAMQLGFAKEDIMTDGLVATVGANPKAALECFETIHYCKHELGLATVCGLSNISFGLPDRAFVNTAFLTMAIANGLTMAIANPSQDLLMNAAAASDMLLCKKDSSIHYINRMQLYGKKQEEQQQKLQANPPVSGKNTAAQGGAGDTLHSTGSGKSQNSFENNAVYQAVLQGDKEQIVSYAKMQLSHGKKPEQVINEYLIPAINKVGDLFEEKKYFLPQLIASANAMKLAIEYLEPLIERTGNESEAATLVIATVEGDIHDIGKNLVVLMLRNYGYHVIDLGKDVPAETILTTAIRENAKVIGLSALMTTTMMRMQEVVNKAKEMHYTGKIIIGGAAITPGFSDEIGADGYSKDASDCVKLVTRLLETAPK